jgi:signal transduction histidine kinase
VAISDNGRGGAGERHGISEKPSTGDDRPSPRATDRSGSGSGLVGIRRRIAALDGTTRISSPIGGPTDIEVELPCGS